ncbi:MAG: hypothetical protein KGJ23_09855 [Euryarchaeota archaeon]|nr:hypothetical protein [Euryarchaeota archaeon]MDE1836907.1 hypothetical protein [Euryarchaeota archaeon]MDE1881485.1 hypothetical protein [Euryarchaeota archaeon]MDE2045310.1 hypothetical protein [Thermoplasmata archaeon]
MGPDTPRGRRIRTQRGQLALFDAVLFLPILALAVVVIDTVLVPPVQGSAASVVGERDAQATLATLLRTTLHETRLPQSSGGTVLLFDQPVSQLLATALQGLGCGTVGTSSLIQAGFVGGDIGSALVNITSGEWTFASLASNATGCGNPAHLDLGPTPPGTENQVYTSWTTLPPLNSGYTSVTVGVELWGP